MNQHQHPLPLAWINKIFATMQGHYGSRFLNLWKTGDMLDNGQDAGLYNAQRTWAEKLAGFEDHPECIAYVLDHLPETPPSLPQFAELCRRAPRKEPLMLAHNLTPDDIKRNKERLSEIMQQLNAKLAVSRNA